MKPTRHKRGWALLTAAVALASGCRERAVPPPAVPESLLGAVVATCAQAQGKVSVRRVGQPYWEPAAVGTAFREGDWLRTGRRATARVAFVAGGGLEVDEQTTVVVEPLAPGAPAPAPVLSLGGGTVRGVAEGAGFPVTFRLPDGSTVAVAAEDPAGRVSFVVSGQAKGAYVSVERGRARLRLDRGREVIVAEGRLAAIEGEQVELAPRPAYPSSREPGIDARVRCAPDKPILLRWAAAERAAGYRLQIARDFSFTQLEVSEELTALERSFVPGSSAVYAWRVAARDDRGRYGEFGFARRIFCEREEAVEWLLAPEDGAVAALDPGGARIAFSWKASGRGAYRLVVARDPGLERDPVLTRSTSEQRLEVEGLSAGRYYWGVFVEGDGARPLFVAPRSFEVRPRPRPKFKAPKTISEWGE